MEAKKYWYNLSTGQVEHGKQSGMTDRMGPYDTAEEAQEALDRAADRTLAADEDEDQWRKAWADEDEGEKDWDPEPATR